MKTILDSNREDFTLGRQLEKQAKLRGELSFIRMGNQDLTYDQFNRLVNQIANGYAQRGIKRGDKVALMLPNSIEFLSSMFALAKLGAISVPINTAYKADLLIHVLNSSDACMLAVDVQWIDRIVQVQHQIPKIKKIVVKGFNEEMNKSSGLIKPMMNFIEMHHHSDLPPSVEVIVSEVQSILFTSGTTGPSKGVEITQSHGLTAALGFIEFVKPTDEDIIFCAMPLFHGVGFWRILAVLMIGAKAVIAERFSASQWWFQIKQSKATIGIGIFAIPSILLAQPFSTQDKNHSLRILTPAPSALDHAMYERFGVHTVENYGGTEVGVCVGAPYDMTTPGSCGRARANFYEVKIFDELDVELACGAIGEICVRSKVQYAITTGYYNDKKETIKAFRNGWFHTGDQGRFDEDGLLYFIDRSKDVVRRRGENISSFEVERVLNTHPSVLESAIIAIPSKLGEDDVKACIVLQHGAKLAHAEILDFCQERLPYFMIPRYLEILDGLPRTPTEKIEKYKLREQGITQNTWDREKYGYSLIR